MKKIQCCVNILRFINFEIMKEEHIFCQISNFIFSFGLFLVMFCIYFILKTFI